MTDPEPDVDVATRWLREAVEELRAAEVVAAHEELPDRVAGFHAHLAAEKALKAELIRLDVEVPRIHDLIGLHRLLPESEQGRFDESDLEALKPVDDRRSVPGGPARLRSLNDRGIAGGGSAGPGRCDHG